MHTTSLHFNSMQDIQHVRHINTDALLKQGKMTVGNHSYSVKLAKDGSIAVSRDHHSSGIKKFFSSAKEAVTHRMMEGSDSSRSERIADTLNAHAHYNRHQMRAQRLAQEQSSQFSPRPTVPARTQSDPTPMRHQPLMSQGEYRDQMVAQYEQDGYDTPDESLIRESYQNYVATNRPASTPSRPTSPASQHSSPPRTESQPILGKQEFGHQMVSQYEQDGYGTPDESMIRESYQSYVAANRPQQTQHESALRPTRTQSAVTADGLMSKREFASVMVAQYHRDGHGDPSESLINENYDRYISAEQHKASSARAQTGMARSKSDTLVELNRRHHDRVKDSIAQLPGGIRQEAGEVLRSFRRASNERRLTLEQQQQVLNRMEKLVGGLWGNAQQSVNGLRNLRQQLESIRERG